MPTKSDCFSPLALGRLAAHQRDPSAREAAHLATCPRCTDLLQNETAATRQAAEEPLPLWLAQAQRPRAHVILRQRRTWVSAMVAACALVVVGLSLRVQDHTSLAESMNEQVKGGVQISGAVKGHDGQVRELTGLAGLGSLRPGEVLQVHVQTPDALQVTLRDADSGEVHYDGALPADGWLPVGLEAERGASMHLVLRACRTAHRCQTWDLR